MTASVRRTLEFAGATVERLNLWYYSDAPATVRPLLDLARRRPVRRAALQKEFIAADQAMTQLKSQSSSLAQFGATTTA